ncbi:MAG: hypothetical protein Q3983_05335 [Capnocytophaga sp.]|nr:hypothetical protein [Capnocytophaga sp.]
MKKLIFLTFLFFFFSCHKKQENIELSVYFWRTNFHFTEEEKTFLAENSIQKLYVRYCDIGLKNGKAIPVAPIEMNKDSKYQEIIPVIYIKNEVFLEENVSPETLSEQISKYISQINKTYDISVKEIQFDCDWTLKSKDKYFNFLKYFNENNNFLLSATIRLHQIKYFSTTGIPPVSYGVLMYYNMGTITAIGKNSIYDRETAKQYLSSLKNYPLRLNVALPLFSWGVHSIGGEVANLVGGLTSKEMKTIKGVEQIGENNIFLVTEQTNYKGRLWQKGDIIKIEEISENEILTMKNDILQNFKNPPKEIILYDLNKNITHYEKTLFKNLR